MSEVCRKIMCFAMSLTAEYSNGLSQILLPSSSTMKGQITFLYPHLQLFVGFATVEPKQVFFSSIDFPRFLFFSTFNFQLQFTSFTHQTHSTLFTHSNSFDINIYQLKLYLFFIIFVVILLTVFTENFHLSLQNFTSHQHSHRLIARSGTRQSIIQ